MSSSRPRSVTRRSRNCWGPTPSTRWTPRPPPPSRPTSTSACGARSRWPSIMRWPDCWPTPVGRRRPSCGTVSPASWAGPPTPRGTGSPPARRAGRSRHPERAGRPRSPRRHGGLVPTGVGRGRPPRPCPPVPGGHGGCGPGGRGRRRHRPGVRCPGRSPAHPGQRPAVRIPAVSCRAGHARRHRVPVVSHSPIRRAPGRHPPPSC